MRRLSALRARWPKGGHPARPKKVTRQAWATATKLPAAVITPTTKAAKGEHDERLTSDEVVERGLVEPELWERVKQVALEIFERGQAVAADAGLILVDTKYEFGMIDGELCLIDEVHTPDSSRYWVAETYAKAMAEGRSPQQFDKEHLRLWLKQQGYSGDGPSR